MAEAIVVDMVEEAIAPIRESMLDGGAYAGLVAHGVYVVSEDQLIALAAQAYSMGKGAGVVIPSAREVRLSDGFDAYNTSPEEAVELTLTAVMQANS